MQEELSREESPSKLENRQQSNPKGRWPSADVNMVFVLPMEFLAPFSVDEGADFPNQIVSWLLIQ